MSGSSAWYWMVPLALGVIIGTALWLMLLGKTAGQLQGLFNLHFGLVEYLIIRMYIIFNLSFLRYNEVDFNCYTFVLSFLRSLRYGRLSEAADNRTEFCEKFIIPRTTAAGKYISLFRKLRQSQNQCCVHKMHQSTLGTNAAVAITARWIFFLVFSHIFKAKSSDHHYWMLWLLSCCSSF